MPKNLLFLPQLLQKYRLFLHQCNHYQLVFAEIQNLYAYNHCIFFLHYLMPVFLPLYFLHYINLHMLEQTQNSLTTNDLLQQVFQYHFVEILHSILKIPLVYLVMANDIYQTYLYLQISHVLQFLAELLLIFHLLHLLFLQLLLNFLHYLTRINPQVFLLNLIFVWYLD